MASSAMVEPSANTSRPVCMVARAPQRSPRVPLTGSVTAAINGNSVVTHCSAATSMSRSARIAASAVVIEDWSNIDSARPLAQVSATSRNGPRLAAEAPCCGFATHPPADWC